MKRKGLKILTTTLVCIFNLFVCFASAFAWFVVANRNDANQMQVEIYTHELDLSYRVLKYIDDEKAAVDVTGQPDALTLQDYDSVIKSRNVNTPIILEFWLSGITLGENTPINISSTLKSVVADYYLSDVIRLKFATFNVQATSANDVYYEVVDYFEDVTEVTFKTGNTKVNEVNYILDNYSSYLTSYGLDLFIMLDYSEDLIDALNISQLDLQTITFANDLKEISCSVYEN